MLSAFCSPNTSRQRVAWTVFAAGLTLLAGCADKKEPPEATLSWLAPQTRAAKPVDCPMEMLSALPNVDYQQIAIVEVSDDYNADQQEVIRLARRKACETGADALVILENTRQTEGGTDGPAYRSIVVGENIHNIPSVGEAGHRGRYFNGMAIIYGTHTPHDLTKDPQ